MATDTEIESIAQTFYMATSAAYQNAHAQGGWFSLPEESMNFYRAIARHHFMLVEELHAKYLESEERAEYILGLRMEAEAEHHDSHEN